MHAKIIKKGDIKMFQKNKKITLMKIFNKKGQNIIN